MSGRHMDAVVMGAPLGGIREDFYGTALHGLRESNAKIHLDGIREDFYDVNLRGLREDDAHLVMSGMAGLREQDAKIDLVAGTKLGEVRQDYRGNYVIAPVRNPVMYREMRLKTVPESQGSWAEDGSGRFHGARIMGRPGMHGIFDFLSPMPSYEEYRGKMQTLLNRWNPLKTRISQLPGQQQAAVYKVIQDSGQDADAFDTLNVYLADGPSGMSRGRVKRIAALEALIPSIENLVAQLSSTPPAATPQEEKARASEAVVKDLQNREAAAMSGGLMSWLLPAGVTLGAVGLVYGIATALSKR